LASLSAAAITGVVEESKQFVSVSPPKLIERSEKQIAPDNLLSVDPDAILSPSVNERPHSTAIKKTPPPLPQPRKFSSDSSSGSRKSSFCDVPSGQISFSVKLSAVSSPSAAVQPSLSPTHKLLVCVISTAPPAAPRSTLQNCLCAPAAMSPRSPARREWHCSCRCTPAPFFFRDFL
jgi:hypothetical protein